MTIIVKKAIAISAWDIFCNGVFVERYNKKHLAVAECESLKRKYLH